MTSGAAVDRRAAGLAALAHMAVDGDVRGDPAKSPAERRTIAPLGAVSRRRWISAAVAPGLISMTARPAGGATSSGAAAQSARKAATASTPSGSDAGASDAMRSATSLG